MRYEDNKWKPIAFILKLLNEVERNYEIYDWKILVIIKCLEKWKYLLEEAQNKFEIWSNYKNLKYFISSQKLNYKQAK